MRNGLLAVFLIINLSVAGSVNDQSTNEVVDERGDFADDQFFAIIDTMLPTPPAKQLVDRFTIASATWDGESRTLQVTAQTNEKKGTFLSLTGLPESTMLDTFRISVDHAAHYVLKLDSSRPVPCQLIIDSAFQTELVDVTNAPASCERQFQISGTIPDPSMANNRVVVTIGKLVFETFADQNGAFELRVYNDSIDEILGIVVDNGNEMVSIYSGPLGELLQDEYSGALAWAAEILGRRHTRLMLASLD